MLNNLIYYYNEKNVINKIKTKFGDFNWISDNKQQYFQFNIKIEGTNNIENIEKYLNNYLMFENDLLFNLKSFKVDNGYLKLLFDYFEVYPINLMQSVQKIDENSIFFIFKQLIQLIDFCYKNNKNGIEIDKNYILVNDKSEIKVIDILLIKDIYKMLNNTDELDELLIDDLEFLTETEEPIKYDYRDEILSSLIILYELTNQKTLCFEDPLVYNQIRNKNLFFKENLNKQLKIFLFDNIEVDHSKKVEISDILLSNFYTSIEIFKEKIDFIAILTEIKKSKINKKVTNSKKISFTNLSQIRFFKYLQNFIFN